MRLVLAVLLLVGCGSPYPKVERSGNPDLDQTATFVRWCVGEARDLGFERPTAILQWMCSISGTASLTPPSEEHEPDLAAAYTGPRPSDDAAWRCVERFGNPRYELVVQADDIDRQIVVAAFDNEGEGFGPVHVWKWTID